jgi:hypothetical protein
MKAQQAVTVVKEVTASAPHVLKTLGCGIFFGLVVPAFAYRAAAGNGPK